MEVWMDGHFKSNANEVTKGCSGMYLPPPLIFRTLNLSAFIYLELKCEV